MGAIHSARRGRRTKRKPGRPPRTTGSERRTGRVAPAGTSARLLFPDPLIFDNSPYYLITRKIRFDRRKVNDGGALLCPRLHRRDRRRVVEGTTPASRRLSWRSYSQPAQPHFDFRTPQWHSCSWVSFMPSRKRTTVALHPRLYRALKIRAAATDRKISDLVNDALRVALREDSLDESAIRKREKEESIPFSQIRRRLKRDGLL